VTILLLLNTKKLTTLSMLFQNCKVKSSLAKRSESNLLMVVKRETTTVVVTAEIEIVAVIVETETVTTEIVVIVETRKTLNAMFARKLVTGQVSVPMALVKAARREVALFAEAPSIR
jgi:hypothetical protein